MKMGGWRTTWLKLTPNITENLWGDQNKSANGKKTRGEGMKGRKRSRKKRETSKLPIEKRNWL